MLRCALGTGQADRVADQAPQSQRLNDVDTVQAHRGHPRHPGDGIAAAAPGGGSAGGCGDEGQRRRDDTPRQQALQAGVQGEGERCDEVGAAVLLERDDGFAARAGIATEGEDGHARINPRADQLRLVGLDGQLARAGGAPFR